MRMSVIVSMVLVSLAASAVDAQVVTRNTTGRGWYNNVGFHNAANDNYFAGNLASGGQHRNFFVVNLAGFTQTIQSARLLLRNPSDGFSSPQGTETYSLFDSSTPIADLLASQSTRTDIYDDLGTGSLFGSFVATSASNGTVVAVDLNAAGIASLNAARGGLWSVGGAITTTDGGAGLTDERLFGFTASGNPADGATRLQFTVPAPSAAGLLGLAGVLATRRRRV